MSVVTMFVFGGKVMAVLKEYQGAGRFPAMQSHNKFYEFDFSSKKWSDSALEIPSRYLITNVFAVY